MPEQQVSEASNVLKTSRSGLLDVVAGVVLGEREVATL